MKFLSLVFLSFLVAVSGQSFAQGTALSQQLQAVDQAYQAQLSKEKAEDVAKQRRAREVANKRAAEKEAERIRQKSIQHRLEDSTVDLLVHKNKLEIESSTLDLDVKRAQAKRVNEYIDRDLASIDADTNTKRSFGDFLRDIAAGIKSFLGGKG